MKTSLIREVDLDKTVIVRELDRTLDLAYSYTFEDALHEIADQIRQLVGAHQSAASYVPDSDFRRAIHTRSFSEKYEKYNTYDVMPTGEGLWAEVVDYRQTQIMTEAEVLAHPRFKHFSDLKDERGLEHPPMPGWLAVPVLRPSGEFIGVLQLSDRYEGDFTADDANQLERFAKVAGMTFELYYINADLQIARERALKAEAKLARANRDLARQNSELSQFAFVASHDLQEPLRSLSSYTQLLADDYEDVLKGDGEKYLKFIGTAARRMNALVRALMDYSRIGRDREVVEVNCSQLIQQVIQDLDSSVQDSQALIEFGQLPTLQGCEAELHQLFLNLISNAIKFRRDEVQPVIKISSAVEPGWSVISVSDNGIGIEEKNLDQIFVIFRRLHPRSMYDGAGIGLAHCKKIAELHGGSITAESISGTGTTFRIRFPR